MIHALIVATAVTAYAAIALATARHCYLRMRDKELQEYPNQQFDGEARLFNGFMALVMGCVWPLVLLVLAVTAKPRKSPSELRAEAREREAYIRKLERELGIGS